MPDRRRCFRLRRLAPFAAFFAVSAAAFGAPPPPPPIFPAAPPPGAAATNGGLERQLAAILDAPELQGASVGVIVRALGANGRIVFARNADLLLVPASNQKILTAAAALMRLGPDYVFVTRLGGVGARDGSMWRGDLVLIGAGDPSLSSARLRELARAVRAKGMRRVTGRIVADDSRFDDKRLGVGWQWDDEPFDYQPQVSALNVDENVVTVRVASGRAPGGPAIVTLDPPTGYVRVVGTVRTMAVKEAAGGVTFDRARGRNDLLVNGALAVGAKAATGTLTVEEPSLFAATRLGELLSEEGIVVAGGPPVRASRPPSRLTPLAESASAPLSVLVRDMMKRSDNLYAETLLKAVGAAADATGPGTTAGGARSASALVAQAGGDPAAVSLRMADGSGLSRLDLVTPRILADLLAYLADPAKAGPSVSRAFGDALPIGGVDGTLRNRFQDTLARGVVRAKTGSLSGVSALSGYVTTKIGEPLVFSILMNNVLAGTAAARRAQDAFVLVLMDVPTR